MRVRVNRTLEKLGEREGAKELEFFAVYLPTENEMIVFVPPSKHNELIHMTVHLGLLSRLL